MTATHDMAPQSGEFDTPQFGPADQSLAVARSRVELDQQIATARAYPRKLRQFLDAAMSMATLSEAVAEECFYALPRKEHGETKMIEGPSTRLAEIVASAWGNCRFGARVVAEDAEFITAQGVFHDLERNTQSTMEVRRRITTKTGKRYGSDMIATTGNAACSIAMRNAIFRGVPKAVWRDVYEAARRTAAGDAKTLVTRRLEMLAYFEKRGATRDAILAAVGAKGEEDIDLEKLATLRGIASALKEGETTIEDAFPSPKPSAAPGDTNARGVEGLAAAAAAKKGPKASPPPATEKTDPNRADLATDCAQVVSALGWSVSELMAWLKTQGVAAETFTRWGDLDSAKLLQLLLELRKIAKGEKPEPEAKRQREPGDDG